MPVLLKMMKTLLILSLLIAVPAAAQFTTVSATVHDPSGVPYSNGTVTFTLVISGTPIFGPPLNFPYSPPTQAIGMDAKGTWVQNLANNTLLLPAGSTWSFHVCSANPPPPIGTGPVCFDVTGIVISGISQDISAQLNAAAPPLTTIPPPTGGTVTSITAGSGINLSPNPCTSTCTISSTAGGGTVTSLTAGTGITLTPNPITTAGTIAGTGGTVTSLTAGTGITLSPNPITGVGTVALTGASVNSGTSPQLAFYSAANTVSGSSFLSQATNGITITGAGGQTSTMTGPINGTAPLTINTPFSSSGTLSSTTAPGSCSAPALNGGGSTGINFGTATTYVGICTSTGGTELARFTSASSTQGLLFASGGNVNWANAGINTSVDTNIHREAGGWLGVASGSTNNNLGGVVSSANSCILTSDTAITSTAPGTTFCTMGFPALSATRNWVIVCHAFYVVSTGTNAVVNLFFTPSFTPANSLNVLGIGDLVSAGAALTLLTTGNNTVASSPTIPTPGGLAHTFDVYGGVGVPTSGGTINVGMAFQSAGFTGLTKAGSACEIQ